jgi:hypothetical protein
LIEIGFADDDRACRTQPRHHGRILLWSRRKRRAGGGRWQTRDVEIVLYCDRNAIKGQVPGVLRF